MSAKLEGVTSTDGVNVLLIISAIVGSGLEVVISTDVKACLNPNIEVRGNSVIYVYRQSVSIGIV